jgi:hypothetical protein
MLIQKINIILGKDITNYQIWIIMDKEYLVDRYAIMNREVSFYTIYNTNNSLHLRLLCDDGNEYHVYNDTKKEYTDEIDLHLIKHNEIGVFNDIIYSFALVDV